MLPKTIRLKSHTHTHTHIYIYILNNLLNNSTYGKGKKNASNSKIKIYNESLSRGKNIYWKKWRKGQPFHTWWASEAKL